MTADYEFDCAVVDGRLVVRGDCDIATARRLGECIAAFDGHDIEVDLRRVTFFDSSALSVLLAARARNAGLRVGELSQEVSMVLKITGTLRYLRGSGDLADIPVVLGAERTAVQLRPDDTDVFERLRLGETAIATASGGTVE